MAAQSADAAENHLTAESSLLDHVNYLTHLAIKQQQVKRQEGMAGDCTSLAWVKKNWPGLGIAHLFYFRPHSEDGLCNRLDSIDFLKELNQQLSDLGLVSRQC